MPKASRISATHDEESGPVLDRLELLDDYAVNFTLFREDIDTAQLLKGLPDDRCQCPHWGYVIKGSITFRFADQEETFEAGDAFYTPPGHTPVNPEPGSEIVTFSPADELAKTGVVVDRNRAAMQDH